jgi:hypothetical protein
MAFSSSDATFLMNCKKKKKNEMRKSEVQTLLQMWTTKIPIGNTTFSEKNHFFFKSPLFFMFFLFAVQPALTHLQFLLHEARAVLVLAEAHHPTHQVAQLPVPTFAP